MLDGHFVLECLAAHDELAKVLVLVSNKIGVVKNRALFELVIVQRWFAVCDLTNQTWFVDIFIWVVTKQVDCSIASSLCIVIIRDEIIIWMMVVCMVICGNDVNEH